MLETVSAVYATDEDVVLRASADFVMLCPRDQMVASGLDGVFESADRWTLSSSTVDFEGQGVARGQVVQLVGPPAGFGPPGELMVVESVDAGSVLLRRKGQGAGVGQPPGPVSGLTGVEFVVATLGPQIKRVCDDLNRRFGIDERRVGRRSVDLADPGALRDAAVLGVLHGQYLDMSREAGGTSDVFAAKARLIKTELDELLARTVVHWASPFDQGGGVAVTSRFSTRLSR